MGEKGIAYTFVGRDQGDELSKIESLINMVIPQATLEGFEASPTPADWEERGPGWQPSQPSKPIVNRFERPYGAAATATATAGGGAPMALPPRTLGSKIPINRRHKRRR
jgi:hypothetical protein